MKSRYLAAVAVLALAACSKSPQELLARAQQEFAGHQYKAAQLDIATALKAMPNDPAAILLQARTALALGDGETARAALERLPAAARPADLALMFGEAALLRQQPDQALAAVAADKSAEAFRIRAQAALLKGDDAAAAQAFAAGDAASGPAARLLADHARYRLHKGDTETARALVARALKADPTSLDARLVAAQLAIAGGDLGGALATYDAIGRDYPGNLAVLTGKAGVLGDLGRTKEMDAVLAAATGAGVTDPSLTWLQARSAAAKNDWKGARDILQANEQQLAGREDAALLYGQVLTRLGQPEQARARLQPLLTRDPANAGVRRVLAEAALAAHDPRGAMEVLKPLAASPDAASSDLRLLADAARQAGDPNAAAYAQRARFPAPQELARTLADGDMAMKSRNWGNAIAAYERILSVTDGKSPLVLNNLAIAQQEVGNRDVALGYALRALKVAPDNPSIMDTAAWLMVQTGQDKTRAVELLRAAAARAPANATIRDHLAEATRA